MIYITRIIIQGSKSLNNKIIILVESTKATYCLDTLALFAVMQYVSYRFLQSTMFPFVYSERYKFLTFALVVLIGVLRFFVLFIIKFCSLYGAGRKSWYVLKCGISACLALPFIFVGHKYDYKVMIFLPMAALCLYDMDYHRVLRWFTFIVGGLLAATTFCSLAGAVRNLISLESDKVCGSYGIINTTDFAAYITFLLLFIWCAAKQHHWVSTLIYALVAGGITWVTYKYVQSRTGLLCGALTEVAILWDCIEEHSLRHQKVTRWLAKGMNWLTILAFPLFCTLTIYLVHLYKEQTPQGINLDRLLSSRLRVTLELYEQYGLHPFAVTMKGMRGNGGTFIRHAWSVAGYGYLDVGYAMLAIRYGTVIFGIVMCLWIWMTGRALRRGDNRIAFTLAIIACHAFSEARFLDINYNIFMAMPFCALSPLKEKVGLESGIPDSTNMRAISADVIKCPDSRSTIGQDKEASRAVITNRWAPYIAAVALVAGIYMGLPRILSWLRTIFSLMGWNTGVQSAYALVISVSLVLLLIGLWQSLCYLWKQKSVRSLIPLAAVLAISLVGVAAGNCIIHCALVDQKERWEKEEQVIKLVQKAATQPVYAAEQEELYRREFSDFSEHIFSTGELYRPPKGTIFTDSSVEALDVLYYGGKYTAISPWSAVYTYDQAVIDAMAAQGYEWKSYYDGVRRCDLTDLAVRNGLKIVGGRLLLDGPVHSVRNNLRWDQFSGTYEVRYVLESSNPANIVGPGTVCTLTVMGESGDKVILEKELTMADFDKDERCDITLSYEIPNTPKVYYLITAADGIQLYLDEISWRRVS